MHLQTVYATRGTETSSTVCLPAGYQHSVPPYHQVHRQHCFRAQAVRVCPQTVLTAHMRAIPSLPSHSLEACSTCSPPSMSPCILCVHRLFLPNISHDSSLSRRKAVPSLAPHRGNYTLWRGAARGGEFRHHSAVDHHKRAIRRWSVWRGHAPWRGPARRTPRVGQHGCTSHGRRRSTL